MARLSNPPDTSFRFNEAGNVILTKPPKIVEVALEALEEVITNGSHRCRYCGKEWAKEVSKFRHEAWCEKNPNRRTSYKKPISDTPKAKKPKKSKNGAKLGRPPKDKDKDILKELKKADKIFGLTDEQIAKYVRGLMK